MGDEAVHDKLLSDVQKALLNYGFHTKTKIIVPSSEYSSFLPTSCFDKTVEIDIYCATKPFRREVNKGQEPTEVLASDFIIECKTGEFSSKDEEQVLILSKNFPIYVACPKELASHYKSKQSTFFKKNQIGLIFFDDANQTLEIVSPAFVKINLDGYPKRLQFVIPHQIFEVFQSSTVEEKVCLPLQLYIDLDKKLTYQHRLDAPKNLDQFLKMREKALSVFQKFGYEYSESWSIFTGITNRRVTFQGFNIQSLIFSFESIHGNKKTKSSYPVRAQPNISFDDHKFDNLWSSWDNSSFTYAICASSPDRQYLLFLIKGRIIFCSNKYTLQFYSGDIFCNENIGTDIRKSLQDSSHPGQSFSIKGTKERSQFFELNPISMNKKNISTTQLVPIQSLTVNYKRGMFVEMESDNPAYYYYGGTFGPFITYVYDSTNRSIFSNKKHIIEPMNGSCIIRNYTVDSIIFQAPMGYQVIL